MNYFYKKIVPKPQRLIYKTQKLVFLKFSLTFNLQDICFYVTQEE